MFSSAAFIKTVPLKLQRREYSESKEGILDYATSVLVCEVFGVFLSVCWSRAVGFDFGTGRVHFCYLCARVPQQETRYDVVFITV